MGCPLTVELENGEIKTITGYTCKKGETYARKEVTNPTRIVTSTVRVEGGRADMVSVKTREDIPKDKIFQCVKALKGVTVKAPIRIGDVVVADVAGKMCIRDRDCDGKQDHRRNRHFVKIITKKW